MGAQNFEQQVTFYHNINVYCAIAALVFLIIAIVLFFILKIPQVLGEITGRKAQKAIDEMTAENSSGALASRKLREDGRRQRRGRTGTLSTGRLKKNTRVHSGGLNSGRFGSDSAGPVSMSGETPTDPLRGNAAGPAGASSSALGAWKQPEDTFGSSATDVLDNFGSEQTDVLDNFGSEQTDVLDNFGSEQTDILNGSPHGPQTGNLTQGQDVVYQQPASETMVLNQSMTSGNAFVIERSIVEIHTDEVI